MCFLSLSAEPMLIYHYSDMSVGVPRITGNLAVCSAALQANNKENPKALHYCPFVRWTRQWPVDSPHKGPVIQKALPSHNNICHQYNPKVLLFSVEMLWMLIIQMYLKILFSYAQTTKIAKFMGPTWGPPGPCRPQMGPMLAPWTLLREHFTKWLHGMVLSMLLYLCLNYWTSQQDN